MREQSSYQIKTIASDVDKEIERLKGQVELFWNKELKHYVEFGLRDGISIVELGSGPGFVTVKIAEMFPNIKITALEIEPLLVDYAKRYMAEKGLAQCEVVEGSILNTGFADNSFDMAITRLVLEHLPDPLSAVREVLRILKPGGKAIFVDNDFELHIMTYPQIPELRDLYDAYCKSRYSEGGNPKIGRELPGILKVAGFQNVDFEIISAHSDIIGEEPFSRSEGIGIPFKLFKDGFLSSKMLGKISVGWRDMLKTENHAIVRQLFIGAGEKTI